MMLHGRSAKTNARLSVWHVLYSTLLQGAFPPAECRQIGDKAKSNTVEELIWDTFDGVH